MEDYLTIIWVIVIVGAMIFNVVSKAAKQAKKQAPKPDKHAQSEAWPSSWDPKGDAEKYGEADQYEHGHQHAPSFEEGTASVKRLDRQPHFEGFEGEAYDAGRIGSGSVFTEGTPSVKGLDRQPAMSYDTQEEQGMLREYNAQRGHDMAVHQRTVSHLSDNHLTNNMAPQKHHYAKQHPERPGESGHDQNETIVEIIDDFDLRTAVIYSEILKPKFNEE